MSDEWNTSKPIDHLLISDIPTEIRAVKTNTKTVLEKEHQALGDDNSGGEHKQGSAISYFLPTASAPTQRPDADTALTIEDAGRLWFDTTTKQLKVLISVGPLVWTVIDAHLLASANTWAAVQTFSEIPIATKGIVANDTYVEGRNEADDGNVPLIKAGRNEADDANVAIVPDGIRTDTDAAPEEDTGVANKKYVDDNTDGGDPTFLDSESDPMTFGESYKAQTSGFVTCWFTNTTSAAIVANVHNDVDPAENGVKVAGARTDSSGAPFISFFVAKDNYFEITTSGLLNVTWTPLAVGGSNPIKQ